MRTEWDWMKAALSLREQRSQILAGNIANADTPNYQARDLDFSTALRQVMTGQAGEGIRRTHPQHLPPAEQVTWKVRPTPSQQASLDKNTVSLDEERAKFTENALHYEALLSFMQIQIGQMQQATQG